MELVVALRLLKWNSPGGRRIQRHFFTVRSGTEVDPRTSRLTVKVIEDALSQLEHRYFLRCDDGFVNEQVRDLRERLDREPPSLLSTEMINLLREWRERALEQAGRTRPHTQVAETKYAPERPPRYFQKHPSRET
ncbi:hypothetical protein [Actinomadura sp. 21ATH]|uniref:hypothetical protein n=1 Tax=Actinomadura sp. 21ATH TaxID=1735444 RepID=UPI0035C02F54